MSEETKREELRQIIGRMYKESLAGVIWGKAGRMFAWLPGMHLWEMHLWLSSLIVLMLSVLFCAIFARLIGASEAFSSASLVYVSSSMIWIWLSINLADWQRKISWMPSSDMRWIFWNCP